MSRTVRRSRSRGRRDFKIEGWPRPDTRVVRRVSADNAVEAMRSRRRCLPQNETKNATVGAHPRVQRRGQGRRPGARLFNLPLEASDEGLSLPERRAARPEAIRARFAHATVDAAAAWRRGLVLYHHNEPWRRPPRRRSPRRRPRVVASYATTPTARAGKTRAKQDFISKAYHTSLTGLQRMH